MNNKTKNMTTAALLLALGFILPYAAGHGLGIPGTVLLPMHIPVLLCGFLCGPLYGAVLGAVLPVLSSILTNMPTIYPMAPIMSMELMTYGLVTGILYKKTKIGRWKFGVYPIMIIAMILGRVMYGLTFRVLFLISGSLKALSVWGAITTGIPGIVVQLVLVPAIVEGIGRYSNIRQKDAVCSAVNLIREQRAACLVIKNNVIVKTEMGCGIGPLINLYDSGILKGACVVDKVVGKAAAMIMTLAEIKECRALTISESAQNWFKAHGVRFEYDESTAYIKNRTGDGMCPMESTVMNIDDMNEAVSALRKKVDELRKNASKN